jgi:hypothetical protein
MSPLLRPSVIKLEQLFEQSIRQFERRESSAELEKLPRGSTIECNDCSAQAGNAFNISADLSISKKRQKRQTNP